MNIGTPLTQCDFGDPTGLFSVNVDKVLGDEWGEIKDIEIITLKQHLYDKATEVAWQLTNHINEIDILIDLLLSNRFTFAKEFVSIQNDKIIIGVNAPKINKNAIKHAFDLLSEVDRLQNQDTIEFGETIEIYEKVA